MRVLSVAFPEMPVGNGLSGGAEQILSILDQALVQRGHKSIVIARTGSRVAGWLLESGSQEEHSRAIRQLLDERAVDLIHFHGLDFYEYMPDCQVPILVTLHLPIAYYPASKLGTERRGVHFNCVSRSQANSDPATRSFEVIPNGIPTDSYTTDESGASLLWLGRICPEKGVHIALEVAHRAGAPLTIAGPLHSYPAHREYFANQVQPLMDEQRKYIGPVELQEKASLLASAKCLLVPSLVPETSSLVAMEALSSGTPVVAFRTGALPEIVDDGETGFLVDSPKQMLEALTQVSDLSRAQCRERASARFGSDQMVDRYVALYERIVTNYALENPRTT